MKEKKVARCKICKTPLQSAIEIEYGLCVHCLSQIDEKNPAKATTKKQNKNPRVLPTKPKQPTSKKPSGKPHFGKIQKTGKPRNLSGKPRSNNVACATKLPQELVDFMENYAKEHDISLSELIRSTLIERFEKHL